MHISKALLIPLFVLGGWPTTLAAQQQPPVIEFSAGAVRFTELTESFVGGSARFYVSPRISLGPEVTYIFGDNHSHVMVTGNLVFDALGPTNSPRRITPFLLAGGGIFQTREGNFNSSDGAFTAGGCVRQSAGSYTFAPEHRLVCDWEDEAAWLPAYIQFAHNRIIIRTPGITTARKAIMRDEDHGWWNGALVIRIVLANTQ